MKSSDLITTLDSLGNPRVLVVGDFILDLYTWGNAERISQEAPVVLMRADRRERKLGGAANVCQMLRGLQAEVSCAGVVGADDAGNHVREMLLDIGVDCRMLMTDSTRPTTAKERFIGRAANRHPHQILRVDSETRDPIARQLERRLIEQLTDCISTFDVVLISDYAKGFCTNNLLRSVIEAASACGVPVVADPVQARDYRLYRGATTITPNRTEAMLATGLTINKPTDAFRVARRLCEVADLEMAIVTLDRDGMALVSRNGRGKLFPTRPRAVYDITGAGDIVLATIGVCLAAGVSAEQAVQLANVAAGLEVEHVGVAVIRREELRAQLIADQQPAATKLVGVTQLVQQVEAIRSRGGRIVFTNGCFDLLHVGHISYLQQAAAMGDVLIIGLNSDTSVRELKGPKRPVIGQQDRAAILAAMACVDFVAIFDEATPEILIEKIRPDVLVKGGDYLPKDVVGRQFVESYGGQVVIAPLVEGVSTTNILKSAAA